MACLELEAEAVYILREAAGQFERPVVLFSGGKDSIVLPWLARKAFAPAAPPMPLLHIDTGHNFEETIAFRDWFAERYRWRLEVRGVADTIARGRAAEERGPHPSRIWRAPEWPRTILPLPVLWKRLAAPRWVFNFGILKV
jgi:sulfate adenylyltransferase subunit 2